MSYHALARKYRPATFSEMVGQEHVTNTLRAAKRKGKLTHAYLFAGPRGCGKTTVARLLAKALNCPDSHEGDPCGKCEVCLSIAMGRYLDVLEIDAASHTGVDNIRDLRDMAQYSPTKGNCRVFIIDEVHMLSKGAFNALLKILEEPPARVFFFFATTEPTKVPRTILSRCQRFDFRLLTREELSTRIQEVAAAEAVTLDASGLRLVVTLAEGSMRDALSILDQLIAGCDEVIEEKAIVQQFGLVRSEVYQELNEAILAHDSRRALHLLDDLASSGQGLDVFAQGVILNFRNLLLLKIDPKLATALDLAPEQIQAFAGQAERFHKQDLLALIDRASLHYERIHRSSQPRILLEAALVEFTLFESRVLLSDLVRRLKALESGGAAGDGGSHNHHAADDTHPTGSHRSGTDISAQSHYRSSDGAGQVGDSMGAVAREQGIPPTAAAADTVPGWSSFIQILLDSHPGLASCLMEGLPSLDGERGRLVVGFPLEKTFQMERLAHERATLEDRIFAHWGRQLKVDLIVTTQPDVRELRETVRRRVAPTAKEILVDACRDDQPLAELVELLQGEPVSPQERESWREVHHDSGPRDQTEIRPKTSGDNPDRREK